MLAVAASSDFASVMQQHSDAGPHLVGNLGRVCSEDEKRVSSL